MTSVTYALSVEGNPFPAAALSRLRRIEVEEHLEMADILRLTFTLAQKPDASGWEVLDDDIFTRLAKVKLTITVGSNNAQPLIEGFVIEANAEYTNAPEGCLLHVVAFDATALMNLEEKIRAWPGVADSDIASAIFGEYNFTPDVEATEPTRTENSVTVIQRGTDIQFLKSLARRNGYECYVDLDASNGQTNGHFHPARYSANPQGVLSVGMGPASTIDSLKVRFDMLRPTATTANNLDTDPEEAQNAEVTSVAAELMGDRSLLGDDRPRKLIVSQAGLTRSGELQTYAQAVTDRSALSIRAEGELNTQSYGGVLRAKRPVLLRGVGPAFGGRYYVERVLHTFEGSNYKQSFTLRRNAIGLTGQEDFTIQAQ